MIKKVLYILTFLAIIIIQGETIAQAPAPTGNERQASESSGPSIRPSSFSPSAIGDSRGEVSLPALTGERQDESGVGDLALSVGAVHFKEMDVTLPGRNGLDVNLGRIYASYAANDMPLDSMFTDESATGAWMGGGWRFNQFMRVICVYSRESQFNHIGVEMNGEYSTYGWANGKYVSKHKPALDYVEIAYRGDKRWPIWDQSVSDVGNIEIKLYKDNGLIYTFAAVRAFAWIMEGVGASVFFVSSIEDRYGNQIRYEYEAAGNHARLSRIIDTYGRQIEFDYGGGFDTLRGFSYPNGNGGRNRVRYHSTEWNTGNGYRRYLQSVEYEGLGSTRYTYQYFDDKGTFPNTDARTYGFAGHLLSSRTTVLGGEIGYQYNQLTGRLRGDQVLIGPERQRVVSQKRVKDGSVWKTYTISYPTTRYGQAASTYYNAPNSYERTFDWVSIDTPAEEMDERYTYTRGLETSHTKGIFSRETQWDFDNKLPISVISKKNNIIQTQKTTQYDAYTNPIKVTTYKGTTPIIEQTIQYETSPTFISQNLIHLPKLTQVKDLSTNQVRSAFVTYTNQGKPSALYEGDSVNSPWTQRFRYDNLGQLIEKTSPIPNGTLSVQTRYAETPSSIQIDQSTNGKTATVLYNKASGLPTQITDINGNITRLTYDHFGRPLTVTYPDNSQDITQYSTDLKTTTHTANGRTTQQTIDTMGRVTLIDTPLDEEDLQFDYYYQNLIANTYKKQNNVWIKKKSYTYDPYLRKTSTMSADWGTTRLQYDSPQMNQITQTDPLNRQSITIQNELGQTLTRIYVPTNERITYQYNNFGDLLYTTDARGLIHKTDLNTYGRPTTGYFTHTTTPIPNSRVTYYPNIPGLIQSTQTLATDGTVCHTYTSDFDNEGRISATKQDNQIKDRLIYDEGQNGKGRLTTADTPDTTTHYRYDAMGRLIQNTTTLKAISQTTQVSYTYHPTNGNLDRLTFSDNKSIQYRYDANQRLESVWYNNERLIQYRYNPNGTLSTLTYGNGVETQYTYEREILINSIRSSRQNNLLYHQSYSYDALGKAISTQHNDYFDNGPSLNRTYTYTPKDALQTVHINNQIQYTHSYDANLNHTQYETPNNRQLSIGNMQISPTQDQLITKVQKDGRSIKLNYDPEGNLISKTRYHANGQEAENYLKFTYNYQGQIQTLRGDMMNARYGYDHAGQRIYTFTVASGYEATKFYTWDQSGHIIAEGLSNAGEGNTFNNQDFTVRYIYSGNQKVAMIRPKDLQNPNAGEDIFYFVNNAQGTPVLITNAQGNIECRYNLDEFGNLGKIDGLPKAELEINFTGKKRDMGSNLYYFNQRYYDPELGRFITHDPAKQGLNPYIYCANNPLMYVDPDGQLFGIDDALIWGVLAVSAKGAAISAGVNASVQLATTGRVNWDAVGSAALSGGFSAGLAFGVGELGTALNGMGGESLLGKSVMHGISGGIQSMAGGGSFGSGFAGGAFGNLTGGLGGSDLFSRTLYGGLGGGLASWATGGSFGGGFQAGAYNQLYNWGLHEAKSMGQELINKLDTFLDNKSLSFGFSVDWFGVSGSLGIGQGPALSTALQTPNLGIGVYGAYNPGGGKNLVTRGKWGPTGGVYTNNYGKPTGFYFGYGASLIPYSGYRSL